MIVRVDFYADLRSLAGCASARFDLPPGASLHSLLAALLERFPRLRPSLQDDAGRLRSDVPVFVDGRNPRLAPDGLEQPLPDQGVVSLFTPIASGRMNVAVLRPALRRSPPAVETQEEQP